MYRLKITVSLQQLSYTKLKIEPFKYPTYACLHNFPCCENALCLSIHCRISFRNAISTVYIKYPSVFHGKQLFHAHEDRWFGDLTKITAEPLITAYVTKDSIAAKLVLKILLPPFFLFPWTHTIFSIQTSTRCCDAGPVGDGVGTFNACPLVATPQLISRLLVTREGANGTHVICCSALQFTMNWRDKRWTSWKKEDQVHQVRRFIYDSGSQSNGQKMGCAEGIQNWLVYF